MSERTHHKSVLFPHPHVEKKDHKKSISRQSRISRISRSQTQSNSLRQSYSQSGHLINHHIKAGERTLLPTYQLYSKTPLLAERLYNIVEMTIRTAVAASAMDYYLEKRSSRFVQSMAREVMLNTMRQDYERFRIVAWVSLMEKSDQSGMAKMGFCWDAEQDQWSKYVFENKNIVITAFVCCVYFE